MVLKKSFIALVIVSVSFILLWGVNGQNDAQKEKQGEENKSAPYYRVKKSEEIVVTATITPHAIKDCSSSVSVLPRNELETTRGSSALGILGHLPGIFVNRSGDYGRADVDIRGLGQNCRQVAVLVDGKPEKMGLFGCAVSHAFPLDNVERIEVVKGAASVLYGGEALGGAINIITRKPVKPFELELTSFIGSYNTRRFNIKNGGNFGKFYYYTTFDRQKSDGHIENSGYSGFSVTGKVGYAFTTKTGLSAQAKYFDGEKKEPGTVNNPVTGYWNDYKRGSVDVSIDHRWKENTINLKVYRNFGKHRFSDGFDSRDYTDGIMTAFIFRGFRNNELLMGGDYKHFGGKNYGYPKGQWDKSEGSIFIQDEYKMGQRVIVLGGLRLQSDSLYGEELCPRLGLVYHLSGKTLLRGETGKGFRSPQLNELYMFPPSQSNLEPERVWNYEIGFEHEFSPSFRVKGSVFHMKGSNMIQTIPNPNGMPKFIFANTGSFAFYGAEVEVDANFFRLFSGNLSYAYLDSGDYTKGRPGQKIDFSLLFNKKRFLASLKGQYVTDYYSGNFSLNRVPSYFLMDIRMSYRVTKHIDVLVDMDNILDREYAIYGEFPGLTAGLYRMPGRNIRFGLQYKQ